ncbi:hypothetical protein [uncultured Ruegeria sp.]|uniref:hypothetical protein n=1 Tax=uncultured Ruegeria sp. TaxID=259304 RepID=UPI00260398F8|nr:hypothetical protein [uncultured Ruegeria sp.]
MADTDFAEGEAAVAAALDAEIEKPQAPIAAPDPRPRAPGAAEGGIIIRGGVPEIKQLPPDAPVIALGTSGNRLYFLDAHKQLRELAAKDVSRAMILHLFGSETNWLYELWPTFKKIEDGVAAVNGWDGTKAQESLMKACARRGLWNPVDHVRGRGAWQQTDGALIIHSGNALHLSDGSQRTAGMVGNYIYPAAVRSLEPAPPKKKDALDGKSAAAELLTLLESWVWAREFDARLLLGWIAASMVAGALRVRPLVWVTGEKGTGKSSLVGEDGVIHHVFGSGILMTANTTAAGLYQKIGYDSLPVAIDEIEAKRGNQKTEAVIELARQAYSGGMVLRGGADHEGKEFRAMCPVLFGSILIPPLMPQDLSRLALLNLLEFHEDAKEPEINKARLGEVGRAMLRRFLDQWGAWPERRGAWFDYLRSLGHDARASNQFGTLLAAADLMLCDSVPDEDEMAAIAGGMSPVNLKETQTQSTNAARCVGYAMSRPIPSMRGGETMMVSELVTCAIRRYGGEMENPTKPLDAVRYLERSGVSVFGQKRDGTTVKLTKTPKLAIYDLKELLDREPGDVEGVFIGFAPDGEGVLELFRGSDWEGVPGAHNPYVQALERVTGAFKSMKPVRLGGRTCRPILIPIDQCIEVPSEKEANTDGP